jgi:hypothetical protein
LSVAETAARATVTAEDRSGAWTVTTLMIFSRVCALMTLAFLLDAARSAATANSAGSGPQPPSVVTVSRPVVDLACY